MVHNYGSPFGRTAVFVQDLLFLSNPEWFSKSERIYFNTMPWFARRSMLVFSSTEAEARRMASFRVPSAVPVGLGISIDPATVPSFVSSELSDLSPGGFVLTVGRLNIRKNVARTIEACLATRSASRILPLVIVGENSYGSTALSRYQVEIENGSIRFVPYVDDSTLAWLYSNAALFIYLSLGEGFGLPPVEAAGFGCRVVVSDIDVFRETLEGYAIFCDPLSIEDVSSAIELALNKPEPEWDRSVVAPYKWSEVVGKMRREMERRLDEISPSSVR